MLAVFRVIAWESLWSFVLLGSGLGEVLRVGFGRDARLT